MYVNDFFIFFFWKKVKEKQISLPLNAYFKSLVLYVYYDI